jgi:hypothetical protein
MPPLALNSIQTSPVIHWAKTRVRIISVNASEMKLRELESGETGTAPMERAEFSGMPAAGDTEGISELILKLSDGSQFTLSKE